MKPLSAATRAGRLEKKLGRELGPLVLSLMEDPGCEDVVLNPDGSVWVYNQEEGFVQIKGQQDQQPRDGTGSIEATMPACPERCFARHQSWPR